MKKSVVPLNWPTGGIDKRRTFQKQPPNTTPDALNVRNDSVNGSRERGGTRPGLEKAFSQQLGGGTPIQMLNTIQFIESDTRKVRLVAAATGTIYREEPSGTMAAVSSGVSLHASKRLQSAERQQILYIADHDDTVATSAADRQPKKYEPSGSGTLSNWTAATAGTIPKGCTCIAAWSDRIVLGGGTTNPANVYFSAQSDPQDWDYAVESAGAAVALPMKDDVTALVPHSDNCLIIGCATSLWIMRGDPGLGSGIRDYISQDIGVVDKGSWCITPEGLFVFLSQDGLYVVPAGCDSARYPTSLSRERMPDELIGINRSTIVATMAYNLRWRGIDIFLTPVTAGTESATHWFFDWETKSFWKVKFGLTSYEPFAVHARRDQTSSESSTVMGCRDGYIRRFVSTAKTDDGTAFDSHIYLGPLGDEKLLNDMGIDKITATLSADSGAVEWSLHCGDTPEEAFDAAARQYGTWTTGRSRAAYPRTRGGATYIKLSGSYDENDIEAERGWEWESGSAVVSERGANRP